MAKSESTLESTQTVMPEDVAQPTEKPKKKRSESLAFRALELSKEEEKKRKKKKKDSKKHK